MKHHLNHADVVVLWLDNDRAGEKICFDVKKFIDEEDLTCTRTKILRAKFSSLYARDIHEAFEGLNTKPDPDMALADNAREEIDLRLGIPISRFLTERLRSDIPDL